MASRGIEVRVRGGTGIFDGMRVSTMMSRNIRNIINIYKNIYKKHIDNQLNPTTLNRNIAEHAGTFFVALFRKCSGHGFSRNIATGLTDKGLQLIDEKKCSGLFRLWTRIAQKPKPQVNRAYQPIHL